VVGQQVMKHSGMPLTPSQAPDKPLVRAVRAILLPPPLMAALSAISKSSSKQAAKQHATGRKPSILNQ
jgi:hypothetical protein